MGEAKRVWKSVERSKVAELFSRLKGDEASKALKKLSVIQSVKKGVSLKGNLFEPILIVDYPNYPLHIPIDLLAYPERRLEFGLHIIKPGYGFSVHVHDYADEVFLVIEGHGKVMIGGKKYDAKPHDVFYIPAGVWHSAYNPEENESDFKLFCVSSPPMALNLRMKGWQLTEDIWKKAGLPPIEEGKNSHK